LFLAGAVLALSAGTAGLPLLAAAARRLQGGLEGAPEPIVAALSHVTGLDWAGQPIHAGLVLLATTAEAGDERFVAEYLSGGTGDVLARVVGLAVNGGGDGGGGGEAGAEVAVDCGEGALEVAMCALCLLRVMPSGELLRYAIAACQRKPSTFAGINVLQGEFGEQLLRSVPSTPLASQLEIAASQEGGSQPLPAILRTFVDVNAEPVRLSAQDAALVLAELVDDES
jgi:hypothetical protein